MPLPPIPLSVRLSHNVKALSRAFGDVQRGVWDTGAHVGGMGVLSGILSPTRSLMNRRLRDQSEHLKYYRYSPPFRKVVGRIGQATAGALWTINAFKGPRESSLAREYRNGSPEVRAMVLREAKKSKQLVPILDHPALSVIQDGCPVPGLVGHMMDKLTEICLIAAGEAFWVLEPNEAGVPGRAWILPPHWVFETPAVGRPSYHVQVPGGGGWDLPAEWVLWFREADPWDPYGRGVGYGAALAEEIETDEDAARQIRLFFHQGMKPEILLMGPGLTESKQEKIGREWVDKLRGLWKRWQFHMIDAPAGAQIHNLSQDFDGEKLTKLRRWDSDIIRETIGVNPEVVGEIVGSNRATSLVARINFRENVVTPRLDYRRAVYNFQLLPLYKSPKPLAVDWALPPVEDTDREISYAEASPWAFSWADQITRQGGVPAPGLEDLYVIPAKSTVVSLGSLIARARADEARALADEAVAVWQAAHPGEIPSAPKVPVDAGGPVGGSGAGSGSATEDQGAPN